MKRAVGQLIFRSNDELEFHQNMLLSQIFSILILMLSGLIVYLTHKLYPNFFNYPYLHIRFHGENLINFWPLFLYGAVMAYIGSRALISTRNDAEILIWGVITSVIAGIWEEIGYRWLFICTAMITLVFSNWILSIFLGFIVANPVFWLYDHISLPIVNFVTFHQFQNIFYNPSYPKLFIYGMISANSSFKDGHKYQGLYGYFNSWIIGFVLMYAMLTYGLTTAIVVHALYDIEISVVRYIFRKIDFM